MGERSITKTEIYCSYTTGLSPYGFSKAGNHSNGFGLQLLLDNTCAHTYFLYNSDFDSVQDVNGKITSIKLLKQL